MSPQACRRSSADPCLSQFQNYRRARGPLPLERSSCASARPCPCSLPWQAPSRNSPAHNSHFRKEAQNTLYTPSARNSQPAPQSSQLTFPTPSTGVQKTTPVVKGSQTIPKAFVIDQHCSHEVEGNYHSFRSVHDGCFVSRQLCFTIQVKLCVEKVYHHETTTD